jgi:hypothetical protein
MNIYLVQLQYSCIAEMCADQLWEEIAKGSGARRLAMFCLQREASLGVPGLLLGCAGSQEGKEQVNQM